MVRKRAVNVLCDNDLIMFPLHQGYNANIITIDHVTPLHEACLGDHVACARALIEAGANVSPAFYYAYLWL